MEWLGILFLYLISGLLKKREQDKKRKEIESDPEWDYEPSQENKKEDSNFNTIINELFEQNPFTQKPNYMASEVLTSDSNHFSFEDTMEETESIAEDLVEDENDITKIDEQSKEFEKNIYHSNLSQRKELHLGNKWKKSTNIKKELFNTKKSLKKSMIIKELLDKPLAQRD